MTPIATPNSTKRSGTSPAQPAASSTPAQPKHRKNETFRGHRPSGAFGRNRGRVQRQVSAGGIIFRHRNGQVEILFLKREDGRWTFPKGKRQLGESHVVAAIREIREETGVKDLRYVAPLGFTAFRYTERHQGPAKQVAKVVHFFLFEAPADSVVKLAGTEGIIDSAWIRADRAFATLSYRNMEKHLAKALRLIFEEGRHQVE